MPPGRNSDLPHPSLWELYRLQAYQLDRSFGPYFGRDSPVWDEGNPGQCRGLVGSAPSRVEVGLFRLLQQSPRCYGPSDGPSDVPESGDDDDDDDDDDRNNPRRQQRAVKAAAALLSAVPLLTGALSPAGGLDSGYGTTSRQVRTWQQVPRGDPMRQMTATASASGGPRSIIYNGRVFRLRRALSAPLQGVLSHVYTEDTPGDEPPVTAEPVPVEGQDTPRSSTASRDSSAPEPFPAYYDYFQQAALSSPPATRSNRTAEDYHTSSTTNTPKLQLGSQKSPLQKPHPRDMSLDPRPDFGSWSRTRVAPPSAKRRLSDTMPAPLAAASLHSPASGRSSSPSAPSPAYHPLLGDDSSLRHPAINGPSPSTTYSSAHGIDAARPAAAAAAAATARPAERGEDVSPWVQNLVGGSDYRPSRDGGEWSTPRRSSWGRGRKNKKKKKKKKRLARLVRRLFSFFRGRGDVADEPSPPPPPHTAASAASAASPRLGIRRLWRRVSCPVRRFRSRSRSPAAAATASPRVKARGRGGAKPAGPSRPTKSDRPGRTADNRPTKSGPSSSWRMKEKRGLARHGEGRRNKAEAEEVASGKKREKKKKKKKKREHRTAKEVAYDFLSPRADAKARWAREAAPLLGAANMVFMAAS